MFRSDQGTKGVGATNELKMNTINAEENCIFTELCNFCKGLV